VSEFGSALATALTYLLKQLKSQLIKRRKKELDEKRPLVEVCSLIQKYRHSGAIKFKNKLLDLLYSAVRHHSR
jgi:hypothetical protein